MKRGVKKVLGIRYKVLGGRKGSGKSNKRGIVSEALPWILISIAVLAILMIAIVVLKDKGILIIDKIKDIFKFR